MRILLSAVLMALLLAPGAVHADDEEKTEGLVMRLFNVGALTQGRPDFVRERGPESPTLRDEEAPLFGSEAEEGWYPVGGIDELIELIQQQVRSESWESTLGARMQALDESTLLVRSFADIVAEVATYLGGLERSIMRRVTVDIEAFRLTTTQVRDALRPGSGLLLDPAKFERLRASDAAGPAVTISAFERHRAAIFSGQQRAYVSDYDVEVSKESVISDPILSVANLGLSADVRPIVGPAGRSVLLTLSAVLSRLVDTRTVERDVGRLIELPQFDVARILSKIELPAGAWALVDGQSSDAGHAHWMFAVRATPEPSEGLTDAARGIALEVPAARPSRRFELRSFDIASLQHAVQSTLGASIALVPSNFTPPEPPELPEPTPIFEDAVIVDLIRNSIVPASWALKGAWIHLENGVLHVRNAPPVLAAIEAQLQVLRREFLWSVVTTSEVVVVDTALARQLESAPGRVLDAPRLAALESAVASGSAKRAGSVRVTTMSGARNAVVSGRNIHYLSDFEVEIAEGANVANPIIQSVLSGAQLDAWPKLAAGGQSVQSVVRFVRTHVRMPLRTVLTPHGELDAPEMDMLHVRAMLQMPLDKTVIMAAAGRDGRRQLLLVTSRLRRATD